MREIKDVLAAALIAPELMEREEFYRAASVNVGALQELCARASGLRGRALEDFFNERFSKVIRIKQEEPYLARATKTKQKER